MLRPGMTQSVWVVAGLLVGAALAGCGDGVDVFETGSDDRALRGGDAGGAGRAGAGPSGNSLEGSGLTCADAASTIMGVLHDPLRHCLETGSAQAIGCAGEFAVGHKCLRRRSDQVEFWTSGNTSVLFSPKVWEECTTEAPPPPPCFAEQCTTAPRSMCTPLVTRERFQCGVASSEWDENCCRRAGCSTSSGCAAGEVCALVDTIASMDCWTTASGDGCDCGGTVSGPGRMVCVPG